VVLLAIAVAVGLTAQAEASMLGRSIARGAARSVGKSLRRSRVCGLLCRDAARDAASPIKTLKKGRVVSRYTTREEAAFAARTGVAAGKHLTARPPRGRPLGPQHAKERYGLAKEPQARIDVEMSAGQRVRANRVMGGTEPGWGELTSPDPLPKEAVRKVIPLR
jgi:hypothetical protein